MKRAASLLLGAAALATAWFSPLLELVPGAFSRHMTAHMTIVAVAAPLITFGIAGTRFDPVCRVPALFPPIPLSVVELVVVWVWHAPALHHFARHTATGLILEQGTFLLSGLLVWLSAFGGARDARAERIGAGVIALLLTSMHMTLLGALLALPPRALYVHPGQANPLDALHDQHLGGAIMLLVGGITYLLGGLWLTGRLLRHWVRPASAALRASDADVKAATRS